MTSKLTQLFDIRNVIGALLGIYGVVLTIAGFAPALLRERATRARPPNNPRGSLFRHRGQLVGGPGADRGVGGVHHLGAAATCKGRGTVA